MNRPPAKMTKPKMTSTTKDQAIDPTLVRELAKLLAETDLSEIEVEKGDLRIRVARQLTAPQTSVPVAPQAVHAAAGARSRRRDARPQASAASRPPTIPARCNSPMVGTAYRCALARRQAVRRGRLAVVKLGDKVLLIEAMKTFNEIVAHRAGTVTAILVEDGQPVEYGEPLMVIE